MGRHVRVPRKRRSRRRPWHGLCIPASSQAGADLAARRPVFDPFCLPKSERPYQLQQRYEVYRATVLSHHYVAAFDDIPCARPGSVEKEALPASTAKLGVSLVPPFASTGGSILTTRCSCVPCCHACVPDVVRQCVCADNFSAPHPPYTGYLTPIHREVWPVLFEAAEAYEQVGAALKKPHFRLTTSRFSRARPASKFCRLLEVELTRWHAADPSQRPYPYGSEPKRSSREARKTAGTTPCWLESSGTAGDSASEVRSFFHCNTTARAAQLP